ncbi:pyruvate formate lyase family protein, partial [Chloroflexota bacterium]
MAIDSSDKPSEDIGAWQEVFNAVRSERVEKARERVRKEAELCLERVRAEVKAYTQYKNEPTLIQRARFLEIFLKEKSRMILEDEFIVGTVGSKTRSAFITTANIPSFAEEMDDPEKDFSTRPYDKILIHPEERKELREEIIPAVQEGVLSLFDYNLKNVDKDILEHTAPGVSSCPHIPI